MAPTTTTPPSQPPAPPRRVVLEARDGHPPMWFDPDAVLSRTPEPGDADPKSRKSAGRYTRTHLARTFALKTRLGGWVMEWAGLDLASGRDVTRYRLMTRDEARRWHEVCRLPVPPELLPGGDGPVYGIPAAATPTTPAESEVAA